MAVSENIVRIIILPGTALPTAPTFGGDGSRLGDVR